MEIKSKRTLLKLGTQHQLTTPLHTSGTVLGSPNLVDGLSAMCGLHTHASGASHVL